MKEKKVRVFELASELNLPPKKVISELNEEFGCDVKSHASGILPSIAKKYKAKYMPEEAAKEKAIEKAIDPKKKDSKSIRDNWIVEFFEAEFGKDKVMVKERKNPALFGVGILHNGKNPDFYTFAKTLRPNMSGIEDVKKVVEIVRRKDKVSKKNNV